MSKNVIFDFDGTLVNSFCAVINAFNCLAAEFGFRQVDEAEIATLRGFSSKELINYFQIPFYKLPQIILKLRTQLRDEMPLLLPFIGLPEVLYRLSELNITLGILTSNSVENVLQWLKCNKMESLFQFIQSESRYFGKTQGLKKLLKAYKMDKLKTFYIGDETRDIVAAKECGIYSVAVTWGFNSTEILSQQQPHYIIHQPEDILAISV